MKIAVLYDEEGKILQTMMGQEVLIAYTAEEMGCRYLLVDEQRDDYDTAFRVVDGALVPQE